MPAFLKADEFIKIVSAIPKRLPRKGVEKEIAKTTIIKSSGETLIIQTPFSETKLPLKGTWSRRAEVDAQLLADAMLGHQGSETIAIAYTQKLFVMSEKTFSIIEPANASKV